jgi:hypothetical protein
LHASFYLCFSEFVYLSFCFAQRNYCTFTCTPK